MSSIRGRRPLKPTVEEEVLLSFLKNNTPRAGHYEPTDPFWGVWIQLSIADGIFIQHNPGFYIPVISLTPKGIQKAQELAFIYNL